MSLEQNIALLSHEARRRQDPMALERAPSWASEWIYQHIGDAEIVHLSGNGGAKSRGMAALDVALLRGLPSLTAYDGSAIPIPVIRPPVSGAVGVPSYKLGSGSLIEALRLLIGEHPHHEERTAGSVSVFYVKHRLDVSDDPMRWSKLYVLPYEGPVPEALRLDFWHGDEPPPTLWLDAIRMRKKAGRRLYGGISMTPIERRFWEPVLKQYPTERQAIIDGRAVIQSSVFDNRFLSEADKTEYARLAKGSAHEKARLWGEPMDASGSNPWPRVDWDAWLAACHPPIRVERLTVQGEKDEETGASLVSISFDLQVYEDPIPNDLYYIPGDSGKGIKDGIHNPDGIHVWSRRRKKQVARVNEYLGGWALGEAMAILHYRYNKAMCDPLQTGGYGRVTLSVLRQRGVRYFAHSFRETDRGAKVGSLGSTETVAYREGGLDYVEQMLLTRSGTIPSVEIVRCLQGLIIDSMGKIVAGPGDRPGDHGEDLSCAIAACRHIQNRAQNLPERRPPAEKSQDETFAEVLRKEFGREVLKPNRNGDRLWDGMTGTGG